MAHVHTLPDGRETGEDIVDPDNPRLHFHFLEGDRTSADAFGSTHTHTINGQITSRPIEKEGKSMVVKEGKLNFHFDKDNVKQVSIDGTNVAAVEGYGATWDIDRGDMFGVKDRFVRGAFQESIADHLKRNRPIRMLNQHKNLIGGFPIDTVREDERGLFMIGHINLDVQEGRETMSLIRQGVLSDFSIGFSIPENGATIEGNLRTITKATIWEVSTVDEPMNPEAQITGFKAVVPFQDLPLADRDREWDSTAAIGRVREFTDSEDAPNSDYKNAFLWYDRDNENTFAAYKLPIADVVNGRLVAVPRAIFAAAAALQGARGGVDIPESDRPGVIRNIERYYDKMDLPSPFDNDEGKMLIIEDVKEMSARDIEQALRDGSRFSKSAAKFLAGRLKSSEEVDKTDKSGDDLGEVLRALKAISLKK